MLVHGIDDSTYVDNTISASSTPDYKRENTLVKMIYSGDNTDKFGPEVTTMAGPI